MPQPADCTSTARSAPGGLTATTDLNLGEADNYRVPDLGLFRNHALHVYAPTAAMVVEVVSPGDESWLKFDHYAAHRVDEVMVVDPADRTVAIFVLTGETYERTDRSELVGLASADIVAAIDWPPNVDDAG